MINWKVRFKNKAFWITLIPLLFLLVHRVLMLCGIDFDFTDIQAQVMGIMEVVFAILGVIGIVTDMTTDGLGDSKRALLYSEPYKDE